jgi:hypothetical protein
VFEEGMKKIAGDIYDDRNGRKMLAIDMAII